MAEWAKIQYSKKQIDKAATAVANSAVLGIDRVEALAVVNNWRSSHSYPLHIHKVTLQIRARKVSVDSLSAQRLKRLSSITTKLRRNSNMKLTQMQDIGGCRAIMPTVQDVRNLVTKYEKADSKSPGDRSEIVEKYDYIDNPKPDGYRSYHIVSKYRSAAPNQQTYNGLRVEIQIRTKLQHAWATAVETISTFTEQALKTGKGSKDWKRFFALAGTAFALKENCPPVPNTPADKDELVKELRHLYDTLQVEPFLNGIALVPQITRSDTPDVRAYLLVLNANAEAMSLSVQTFRANELNQASDEYLRTEEEHADDPAVQVVLVSVDSLMALSSAYPNYYLDTREFLNAIREAIKQ